ncbi:MAG: XRE family transcriptional regulator [Cytophagaceae bacterium]|nr:MAG: XRE family transcriptional regulator [Cytophagaceae bacterium]
MIINTIEEYREAFRQFDAFEAQGIDATLEIQPAARALAEAIQDYELRQEMFPIPKKPTTLPAMIELKRQQRQLKQKDLAQLLEVPAGRLSQILSGKRRVTMDLAKKLYERLDISPEFILKTA